MAYLREIIVPACVQVGCLRKASTTLCRRDNEPLGSYCSGHAHSALLRQQEREDAETR